MATSLWSRLNGLILSRRPRPVYPFRWFAGPAVAVLLLAGGSPADAQHAYAGVWRGGTDGYVLWVGDTWVGFEAQWQNLAAQDLRLIDFETDVVSGDRVFSGVWRAGTDAYALWVGGTWTEFEAQWQTLAGRGLRLIDLEIYVDDGVRRYAGVWRAGTDGHALWVGDTWPEFEAQWQALAAQGLRLIDLETYDDGGVRRYAGVWRSGTDGHALWVGDTWPGFVNQWQNLTASGLRLIDIETYVAGGVRRFAGVWRAGSDSHALWVGVDWENFVARWRGFGNDDLRLIDIERYPGCSASCANKVVAPDSYNYWVTGDTVYRWPVNSAADGDFVRLSAVHFTATPFMTLPFSDSQVKRRGTWRYSNNTWHHAIDYSRDDATTYTIEAAAPGEVVHVGWDNWSGNTVIVSHTVDGVSNAFRTLYMHLRNGASADCTNAWNNTVPTLSGTNLTEYVTHLNETGCSQDPASRALDTAHWGTNSQTIPVVVGQQVARGQMVAWAGNTGPGGKKGTGGPNTHLHMFTARRDPTDNEYYFIDPYGLYASPPCYPSTPGGNSGGPCARYPNIWGDGPTWVFSGNFDWGDFTGWDSIEFGGDPGTPR